MKKLTAITTILVLIVSLMTGCQASSIEKFEVGQAQMTQGDYDQAKEVFDEVLVMDETFWAAWENLVLIYLNQDDFQQAENTLLDYYTVVKNNLDDLDDLTIRAQMKKIQIYGRDLERADYSLGDWYQEAVPIMPDLTLVDENFDMETPLLLNLPDNAKAYYTLDGSIPSELDQQVPLNEPLTMDEGDYMLGVVYINEYGVASIPAFLSVEAYRKPPALTLSLEGGAYEGPIEIYLTDYDYENMDVYYTIDGSDPMTDGYYYDEYSGIKMTNGRYNLRVVYYDYTTDRVSKETVAEYDVTNPNAVSEYTEITIAVFGVSDYAFEELQYAADDLNYYEDNMVVSLYEAVSLEELITDLDTGYADGYYGPAMYVEDVQAYDLLMPTDAFQSTEGIAFYKNAMEAGSYKGTTYTWPVTISPNLMLFYDSYDVTDYYVDIDSWQALIDVANQGYDDYNFLYPEDHAGEWLLAFYAGMGGKVAYDENGLVVSDETTMAKALQLAYDLPSLYGLGYEGMDYATYSDALYYGEATTVFADAYDVVINDESYLYTPAGAMPLPDGGYASAINLVDGLHINKQLNQANELSVARVFYRYIARDYYVNYIAGYDERIPAIGTAVDLDSLWLTGDFADYEHAVMNNITIPFTFAVMDDIEAMGEVLYEVMMGRLTVQEGVANILENN